MKIPNLSACLVVGLFSLTACDDVKPPSTDIRVMTRNVSIGGDIDRVIAAASIEEVPVAVLLTWQEIVANDFSVRAAALAAEIDAADPHLVGLQEITTLRVQNPGDMAGGGTVPATEVAYDYLETLLSALQDRGLDYEVAGIIADTDAEMPMVVSADPLAFWDIRMNDYDVVLARSDVSVSQVVTGNYDVNLQVDLGGSMLTVLRGYVAMDATVGDVQFRFISTHLEPVAVPELQELQLAQAGQLAGMLGEGTTIVVGDLNTGPGDATYELLESSGLSDAWIDVHGTDPGLSCCYMPNLRPGRDLDTRYDLVLYRNGAMSLLDPSKARLSGTGLIPGAGFYPSDHAGVTVTFTTE